MARFKTRMAEFQVCGLDNNKAACELFPCAANDWIDNLLFIYGVNAVQHQLLVVFNGIICQNVRLDAGRELHSVQIQANLV